MYIGFSSTRSHTLYKETNKHTLTKKQAFKFKHKSKHFPVNNFKQLIFLNAFRKQQFSDFWYIGVLNTFRKFMRLDFVDSEVFRNMFRKMFKLKHVSGKCFTIYVT